MSHTNIAGNVSSLKPAIQASHQHQPHLPYVLGETNSDSANINYTQVEGVFGSTLWEIDRIFTSMAANIKRSNFIVGTTFSYTGWVPVPYGGREPYVRPPLYAPIFTADALGHASETKVYPLPDSKDKFASHAIYESGKLAKYVLINLEEWNSTTAYVRPSQEVRLAVPPQIREVEVERLTGNGASADEDIQWAGMSWNYTDGRLVEKGEHMIEKLRARRGVVTLKVPSTEAVLVTLGDGRFDYEEH